MIIALTGTPGTGKTTTASLLKDKGYTVVEINKLAKEKGFVEGYDQERNCDVIDVEKVEEYLKKNLFKKKGNIILDGLLSHLIKNVDIVVILRCHPEELKKRLKTKGWSERKISENVEAEALDVILCEAAELHEKKCLFEIDTTHKTVREVAEIVDDIVNGRFNKGKYDIGGIDWSEETFTG
ncbi:MAG TPA: dephospho-CoA kinase [Thermoplasmatales archaeon]|nr:dephospho-CoA kinase [Thermoplasmatales archaeon]